MSVSEDLPFSDEDLLLLAEGRELDPTRLAAIQGNPEALSRLVSMIDLIGRLRLLAGDKDLPVSFADIAAYEAGAFRDTVTRSKVEAFLLDNPDFGSVSGMPPTAITPAPAQ